MKRLIQHRLDSEMGNLGLGKTRMRKDISRISPSVHGKFHIWVLVILLSSLASLCFAIPQKIAVSGALLDEEDNPIEGEFLMLVSFYFFYRGLIGEGTATRLLAVFLSSLAYLAAIFTKELALVLPLLFVSYALIFGRIRNHRIPWLHFVGYVAALSVYFVVRVGVLGEVGQGGVGELAYDVRIAGAIDGWNLKLVRSYVHQGSGPLT